jgi:hypothetical protein
MRRRSLDIFCKNRRFRVHFGGFLPIQNMKQQLKPGRQHQDAGQAQARRVVIIKPKIMTGSADARSLQCFT